MPSNGIPDDATVYVVTVDVDNISEIGFCVYALSEEKANDSLARNIPKDVRRKKFCELSKVFRELLQKHNGAFVAR